MIGVSKFDRVGVSKNARVMVSKIATHKEYIVRIY